MRSPVLSPLYSGLGARRYHALSAHDDAEIALILETLANRLSPDLAELRILELACGSGRVTLPMATAGHRVLATDLSPDMLEVLRSCITEQDSTTKTPGDLVGRIEVQQANMSSFSFTERFKAVCLPTASITQLDADQRRGALECSARSLAPGGLLIISTDDITGDLTTTIEIQPGISLTEELNQTQGRRRSILRWGEESYVSELHLVSSSWISNACSELGLTVVEHHSTPDQAMPDHTGVLLVARKP